MAKLNHSMINCWFTVAMGQHGTTGKVPHITLCRELNVERDVPLGPPFLVHPWDEPLPQEVT